jgi:hypothetical protein
VITVYVGTDDEHQAVLSAFTSELGRAVPFRIIVAGRNYDYLAGWAGLRGIEVP